VITLGISQRERDRVLEALGLGRRGPTSDRDAGADDGGQPPENPRRMFRRAFYVAIAGLITAGLGWAGKQAGEGMLSGLRAEISVHRAVAAHGHQLDDHEQRLQHVEAQASARVVLPPDAAAQVARLIKLLEADAKARDGKAVAP
jgi:hypothetical protein